MEDSYVVKKELRLKSNGCDPTGGWVASGPMDEIRRRIEKRLEELGKSQSWLSQALDHNRAYIHQYIKTGSPRDLPYDVKLKVAELLQMSPRDLGIASIESRHGAPPRGMREDAEPFVPKPGGMLAHSPTIGYFTMRSAALDQAQPTPIRPGQILAFDLNRNDPTKIPSGKIVVVSLLDKRELARTHGVLIRIFMPPNKLLTNSEGANEILSIDDPSLPWEPVIRGTLLSVLQDFN